MDTISEEYSLTWKGHSQHVRSSFYKLQQSNDFCDVTLYADGRKIGAHKVLLSTCSDYFKQLFDDIKDQRPIVILKGLQFQTLQQILKFMYNGEVSIEVEKLSSFLEAADFLKVYGLTRDGVSRTKIHSLVSESDHSSNPGEPINSTESHYRAVSFSTDLDSQQDDLDTHQETINRNPDKRSHGYKRKEIVRSPTFCSIESYLNRASIVEDDNMRNVESSRPTVELGKYPQDSPERTGEWTSDYDRHQNTPAGSRDVILPALEEIPLPMSPYPSPTNLPNNKRRKVKSERLSCDLENEVVPLNQQQEIGDSLNRELGVSSSNSDKSNQYSSDDEFLEKSYSATPLTVTGKDSFECKICNRSFAKKDSLKKHSAMHFKETSCTICGATLSRKGNLLRHLKIMHGFSESQLKIHK